MDILFGSSSMPKPVAFGRPIHIDSATNAAVTTFDLVFDHHKGTEMLIRSTIREFEQKRNDSETQNIATMAKCSTQLSADTFPSLLETLPNLQSLNDQIGELEQLSATVAGMELLKLRQGSEKQEHHLASLAKKRAIYEKQEFKAKIESINAHHQQEVAQMLHYYKNFEEARNQKFSEASNTHGSDTIQQSSDASVPIPSSNSLVQSENSVESPVETQDSSDSGSGSVSDETC